MTICDAGVCGRDDDRGLNRGRATEGAAPAGVAEDDSGGGGDDNDDAEAERADAGTASPYEAGPCDGPGTMTEKGDGLFGAECSAGAEAFDAAVVDVVVKFGDGPGPPSEVETAGDDANWDAE